MYFFTSTRYTQFSYIVLFSVLTISFLQNSYDIPVEVEVLPQSDGTLCLNNPVNRADLRQAGVEFVGGELLMDSLGHSTVLSWVPVEWDEPFIYSVSGPTIMNHSGVITFYDFQR